MPVITPVFKERRNGELKIISFFAKQARGAMARFIVQNRLRNPEALKEFASGGYQFEPGESNAESFVFSRESTAA